MNLLTTRSTLRSQSSPLSRRSPRLACDQVDFEFCGGDLRGGMAPQHFWSDSLDVTHSRGDVAGHTLKFDSASAQLLYDKSQADLQRGAALRKPRPDVEPIRREQRRLALIAA